MSGDVQPRKRKDKKRRKDEGEQIPTQTHAPLSTNSSNDDLNIHIHKEGGTGGGLCAKLVFFVLLSAIAVLIGMIITEYRGQTDVDTVDTESRFSQIFEGWIDASPDHHEHDIEEDLEDHVLDHDEEEDVDNNSEPEDEDDEHESSQEEDEEELISADNEISEEDEDNEEDQDEDEEQDDQTLEESEENQLDQDEDDDEVQGSEEEERETYEDSNEKEDEDVEADEDDDEDHDDDEQELQNIDSEEKENDNDDELADEEDEISAENKSDEGEEEYDDDDDDNDKVDEDDADEHNEKVPDTAKKIKIRDVGDDEAPPNEKQQESSGMAVKLGVGVALLVVAHLVLVRKWRSAPDDKPSKEESKEPTPDLSRRNTIVVPPTYQEVEQDIEQEEEDYSDEEVSEEESRDEPKSAKTKYQELRSTYTRSLTPEGEIDYHKPSETYDDEYEDNIEDEADEEVSEEEEDDEEGDEEEDEEGDEEDESENEEFDEDEELLKRLEAKYGKLHDKHKGAAAHQDVEDSDSDKQSDEAAGYEYSNITSKEDYKIKGEIDKAQKKVQNNSAYAIKLFDKILQKYPSSPRSIYGKALALDYLADQRRSNEILEQALKIYIQLLNTENVPHALFEMAAERCINRMRFVGQYKNAIMVHKQLIKRFPNNPKHTNDLAVTYLTINRVEEARSVLKEVLRMWPNNGFALVHLGFIFKTSDNKLQEAVEYLRRGLDTKDKGVIDGRFYFHLGDAMTRLGQNKEAMEVYEEGVKNEVFLSKYQRSLYNVPRLTGKPWWQLEDLPYLDLYRLLKQNWHKIKEEGLAALNEKGYFQDESENLRDSGEWKQFELFARGQKNARNCKKCPFTCSIIEKIPEARGCKRGQTKFSVMHPGTHVWPHCGPTNCRLRTHLGLKVPPKTFIRVAEEIRSWDEGEIFVFDDSFEHEVWHNGTEFRLVLIIDVWHPELTPVEKRNLSPI